MFKFSKTGTDVTSAAIELSTYNGREKIFKLWISWWHDWSAASLKEIMVYKI